MKKLEMDLTGQKFGYLTVIDSDDGCHWNCKCKCGKIVVITTSRLLEHRVGSCGCKRDRNGKRSNDDFARRVKSEWTRQWGKYSKPFEFNIAVTEVNKK